MKKFDTLTVTNLRLLTNDEQAAELAEKNAVDGQFCLTYDNQTKQLHVLYQARNLVRHKKKYKQTRSPWQTIDTIIPYEIST